MDRKKAWKIGLLSALFPTVVAVLAIGVIVFVFQYVSNNGLVEIERKTGYYAQLAEYAPKKATVFFGDSITEICPIEDLYGDYAEQSGSPVINRGISSETAASMLARVNESVIALQPRNLVMLMGINDLNQGIAPAEAAGNIRAIIQRVKEESPQTNIVLQSVYPTDIKRESFYEPLHIFADNDQVLALNGLLAELAAEENIRYVDLTSVLADESGYLRDDYTYDGVHPSTSGYLAVRDLIIAELV